MMKIVKNANFLKEEEKYDEITEHFVEFLKKNTSIKYTNAKYFLIQY